MSDAWEPGVTAIGTDTVLKKQVTAINADLDAVAEQSHDSVTGH
ncbi:MAG: hypothetical protein ABSE40_22370 [Candidatus Sulfotelmatobacter sp.]|jgi:hypothetical protein